MRDISFSLSFIFQGFRQESISLDRLSKEASFDLLSCREDVAKLSNFFFQQTLHRLEAKMKIHKLSFMLKEVKTCLYHEPIEFEMNT